MPILSGWVFSSGQHIESCHNTVEPPFIKGTYVPHGRKGNGVIDVCDQDHKKCPLNRGIPLSRLD